MMKKGKHKGFESLPFLHVTVDLDAYRIVWQGKIYASRLQLVYAVNMTLTISQWQTLKGIVNYLITEVVFVLYVCLLFSRISKTDFTEICQEIQPRVEKRVTLVNISLNRLLFYCWCYY